MTTQMDQPPTTPTADPASGKPEAANNMGYKGLALRWLADHSSGKIPHLVFWEDQFHLWDMGYYNRYKHDVMATIIHQWLMEKDIHSDRFVAEKVAHCLRALRLLLVRDVQPFWLDPFQHLNADNREWVAMASEMISPPKYTSGSKFTVSKRALTPAWFTPCKIPYDFVEGATCPAWEEWLAERVPDHDLRLLLQEFFGYCLLPDTSKQSALFLVGDSGTGKSTILKVLLHMLGEVNCSNIPLESFNKTFILGHSQGKLLNWCDESQKILPAGIEQMLKWYISGSPITVDRKYMSAIDMVPTARLAVCVNSWPQFRDSTDGIWRRILCVPVTKVMPVSSHRPEVTERLLSQLPGIFNWALVGYRRLKDNGHFTPTVAGAAELASIQSEQQSHRTFVAECVAPKRGGFALNEDLFGCYRRWCESRGVPVESTIRTLLAEIRKQYPDAEPFTKKIPGTALTRRGYRGIIVS